MGVQTELGVWASRKIKPSSAMRFSLGVLILHCGLVGEISPIPRSSAMTRTTLGRSAAWVCKEAKSVNVVTAHSIVIDMRRSDRFEIKTLDVFMMLTWIADTMWGNDDRVKRKFLHPSRLRDATIYLGRPQAGWV